MSLQHLSPSTFPETHGSSDARDQASNRFLSSLSQADLATLKPSLLERPLRHGECLQRPGQLIESVIFPLTGIISLTVPTKRGISVEAAMIGREGVLGVGAGFGIPHSLSTAVVQLPGSALAISVTQFREAIAQSSQMREQAARCVAIVLIQAQQSAACNAVHEVEERMARWLLETYDRSDRDELPLTQTFLAEMLGVQRTTVTLMAGKLQKTGAIRTFRGRIQIADRAILEAAACECYERIRTTTRQLIRPAGCSAGQSRAG
jgi:CRP-like cAMP-binding protein